MIRYTKGIGGDCMPDCEKCTLPCDPKLITKEGKYAAIVPCSVEPIPAEVIEDAQTGVRMRPGGMVYVEQAALS